MFVRCRADFSSCATVSLRIKMYHDIGFRPVEENGAFTKLVVRTCFAVKDRPCCLLRSCLLILCPRRFATSARRSRSRHVSSLEGYRAGFLGHVGLSKDFFQHDEPAVGKAQRLRAWLRGASPAAGGGVDVGPGIACWGTYPVYLLIMLLQCVASLFENAPALGESEASSYNRESCVRRDRAQPRWEVVRPSQPSLSPTTETSTQASTHLQDVQWYSTQRSAHLPPRRLFPASVPRSFNHPARLTRSPDARRVAQGITHSQRCRSYQRRPQPSAECDWEECGRG